MLSDIYFQQYKKAAELHLVRRYDDVGQENYKNGHDITLTARTSNGIGFVGRKSRRDGSIFILYTDTLVASPYICFQTATTNI